jgi:hypothetical protein
MPGGPLLKTKKGGFMEKKDRNKKKKSVETWEEEVEGKRRDKILRSPRGEAAVESHHLREHPNAHVWRARQSGS